MNDETRTWLAYAHENLASAKVLLDSELYNPCLQNIQQAVEKMLKGVLIARQEKLRKTHSIAELMVALGESRNLVTLTEDEIDLPSKYPLGTVLPDFEPDRTLCQNCIDIAERVRDSVASLLRGDI